MISVPNHRQPLSGNNLVICLLAFCLLAACTSQKRAIDKSSGVEKDTPKTEEMVEQYDPVTGEVVLVPKSEIKVDTVIWTEDTTPPLVTDEDIKQRIPTAENPAQIALLMPFDAAHVGLFSDHQDPRLNRYLHYYAGMQLALDELKPLDLPLQFHAYDADAVSNSFAMMSRKPEIAEADVIVGPYDKKDIEAYASFGQANEIMVLSPWRPSFQPETENPFFLQLSPGLDAHVEALTRYIHQQYPDDDVYVVGRDQESEINRIRMFSEHELHHFEELIVTDTTPDLLETDLRILMDTLETTVFVLPYYSRSDEAFVNEFMRKLHADSHVRDIIVFGLPQWVGFTNLNPNYMESLHLHLSVTDFIDRAHPGYEPFRQKFFDKYHVVPDINAYMGFDFMEWMARTVSEKGADGLIQSPEATYGLASGFHMLPVYPKDTLAQQEMQIPLYYENQSIRILRFEEQDFYLVR